jgi:serine/threonine protein kinase
MGEVYKARDTRLNRDVALKILPDSFANDAERLRRFEQETHVVAALNHPNILAIYDVGTRDNSPFLVSELLDREPSFAARPRTDCAAQSDRVCGADRERAGGGARQRDRSQRFKT